MDRRSLSLFIISIVLVVIAPISVLLPTWADESSSGPIRMPVHPVVERLWRTSDGALLDGDVARGWVWGPEALAMTVETDPGSALGRRQMVYFEKGRLDVVNPTLDPSDPWFATGAALVSEMVAGSAVIGGLQVELSPATFPVSGDLDQTNGVTYATFNALRAATGGGEVNGDLSVLAGQSSTARVANQYGATITALLLPSGDVQPTAVVDSQVIIGGYDDVAGHNIAAPFAAFDAAAPYPPTWLLGHPLSEPYWVDTVVLGTVKRVLVQPFERRVLSYTPDNPAAWQVESANTGSHYRQWRGLSQPMDGSLTGLASIEPFGEELIAAAAVAGVDPYLFVAVAQTQAGNDMAHFARNAPGAATSLAGTSAGAGDVKSALLDYFNDESLASAALARRDELRAGYAPQPSDDAKALDEHGTAVVYPSIYTQTWWERSLNWHASWGGAMPGYQTNAQGYYCARPGYAPGEMLRLVANDVTIDCTVAAAPLGYGMAYWVDQWVVEMNDAAASALGIASGGDVHVLGASALGTDSRGLAITTPGVLIGSGAAAYYSPSYTRDWWEWAMGYYAGKGLITPGWTLDPNGHYCVHPNYIPGDRLRLVANGITLDCTVGDMVADQDVYNWRQKFVVELAWDTFAALGLDKNNSVDVYYLGLEPKPERVGEPPTETATPEPTTELPPPATPTVDPPPAQPTPTPTETPTTEPTAVPTEEPTATPEPSEEPAEPTAEPTAVPTEAPPTVPPTKPDDLPTKTPVPIDVR
jgi:hypothetical protein